jgi:hypothetical protein
MTKGQFCICASTLRDYASWERKLYECGMDLTGTPAAHLAENIHAAMCEFDPEWSYDTKLGIDWIIEWSFGEARYEKRHGREFVLDNASALYDFLVFMNEHGWED